MHIAYVPSSVALFGLLTYTFGRHGKAAEIGRILFFAGMTALMFSMNTPTLKLPF